MGRLAVDVARLGLAALRAAVRETGLVRLQLKLFRTHNTYSNRESHTALMIQLAAPAPNHLRRRFKPHRHPRAPSLPGVSSAAAFSSPAALLVASAGSRWRGTHRRYRLLWRYCSDLRPCPAPTCGVLTMISAKPNPASPTASPEHQESQQRTHRQTHSPKSNSTASATEIPLNATPASR